MDPDANGTAANGTVAEENETVIRTDPGANEIAEVENLPSNKVYPDIDETVRERKLAEMQIDPRYSGIGGWLILVMIGLFGTPVRVSLLIFNDLLPIFTDGTLQLLITPETEFYHPLWLPLLLYEVFSNAFFAVFAIVLLVHFFRRKKTLPKLIIIYFAANILMLVIDEIMGSFIPFITAQSETGSYTELMRSIVSGAIWIPYFCKSVRVKSTFVR